MQFGGTNKCRTNRTPHLLKLCQHYVSEARAEQQDCNLATEIGRAPAGSTMTRKIDLAELEKGDGWAKRFANQAHLFPQLMRQCLEVAFTESWRSQLLDPFSFCNGNPPEFKFEFIGLDIRYLLRAIK